MIHKSNQQYDRPSRANIFRHMLLLFVLLFTLPAFSSDAKVKGMRFWQSPDRTRVVLDLSDAVNANVFSLQSPERIVIDLPNTEFGLDLDAVTVTSDLVDKVRQSATTENQGIRIVLDLKSPAIVKTFNLKPYLEYGHRLVIDLTNNTNQKMPPKKSLAQLHMDNVIIAVDAGHGGEDPGASGYTKKQEKYITLALAKKLVTRLNKIDGITAFLTRDGDYYVGLHKRTFIARQQRAHIFVSIHADAFPNKKVKGASIWTLSNKRSNSEVGRWLASKANEDLLGVDDDLDLKQFDPQVAQTLVSLSLEYAVGSSIDIAKDVLSNLKSVSVLHSPHPRQESFAVLTSPGIPSILVESGFISNPNDEKNLSSINYQNKFTQALTSGLLHYIKNHPPEGTKFASLNSQKINHLVKSGETLSAIALSYGVTVNDIKSSNQLSGNLVKIGQVLQIPQ